MPMIELAHETAVWLLDYLPLIGSAAVARIREKVERLRGVRLRIPRNGGGVAELLSQLMRLFNNAGSQDT